MKKKEKTAEAKLEDKELLKFLLNVDLFNNLTKLERKNLLKYVYIRHYKKDEIVFKKGYPDVVLYIVRTGKLKVYLDESFGGLEVNVLNSTEFVGEMGLFKHDLRTASVSSIEETTLLAISKKDLSEFIRKFPRAGAKILYKLGEILCEHIVQLNEKISGE